MIVQIYCYRDVQVGAFTGKPIYALEEPEIEKVVIARTVMQMAKEDIDKAKVRDLELYHLGTFNDETGVIISRPQFLIRLADYIKEVKPYEQSVQSGSNEEA